MSGHQILVVAILAAGYAVWAYTHPWRKCWACGGKGTNRGSTGRRWGDCWRCGGSRKVKTLGSQLLHRLVRAARQQKWRKK